MLKIPPPEIDSRLPHLQTQVHFYGGTFTYLEDLDSGVKYTHHLNAET